MELKVILERNFTSMSDVYRRFAEKKDECRKCSLYDHYKQVGQSEGNPVNPTFMFIGEALGKDEVEQVRPFVGRAGQRLRQELRKHPNTFNRKSTLISNILACRPLNNVFPKDSAGSYWHTEGPYEKVCKARELVNHCATLWLRREIQLVQPKVIVTLGSQSLDYVRGDRGITAHRGTWKFLPAFQAWSMATYHPSYVLRCSNDSAKEHIPHQFAEDIEKIAKGWRDVVDQDPRMEMNPDEWKQSRALDNAISRGIIMAEPIDD